MKKSIIRLVALLFCLASLVITLFLFKPDWIVSALTSSHSSVLFRVDTDEPLVALTIDDGPDPATTRPILDILKENDARATFFIITSHIPGNEGLIEQMMAEGHELGNHTVYDEASITLDATEFNDKFLEADGILRQFGPVKWFRPGSGLYDRQMIEFVESYGYQTALGALDPLDPQIQWADFASWYILQNVRPGSILILHDCGERGQRTAEVLEEVLPELSRRGYRVVTLTELADLEQAGEG